MNKLSFFTIITIVLFSCQSVNNEIDKNENKMDTTEIVAVKEVNPFVAKIEEVHHAEIWNSKKVFKCKFELYFGGNLRFKGFLYTTPSATKTRLESEDGTIMIFDGQNAYISPDTSTYERARFDVLTWSYFLAAPYKLSDQGTKIEEQGVRLLNDVPYDAAKLSFEANVGDSPDDWYILYKDQKRNLLSAMAYIVTYGKSKEEANQNPHCITYESFIEFEGIPFATVWNFWTWTPAGEMDKLLGTAKLSYFEFVDSASDLFTKNENFKIAPMPSDK